MDSITAFSARILLSKDAKSPPAVSFPLVQGMPFVTALYNGAMPRIQTGVFFKTVTRVTKSSKANVTKFNFNLQDGTTWRVYAHKTKGDDLELEVVNNMMAQSKKPFFGSIQVAKDPGSGGTEAALDDGAGIYPVTVKLSGTAAGEDGSYSFKFERAGHDAGNLYMFALPHHVESFDNKTTSAVTKAQLQSTTKGLATMVRGSQWTMVEKMPTSMGFAPWDPKKGDMTKLSDQAKGKVAASARQELTSQVMAAQTNIDSMYFSGKVRLTFPD